MLWRAAERCHLSPFDAMGLSHMQQMKMIAYSWLRDAEEQEAMKRIAEKSS